MIDLRDIRRTIEAAKEGGSGVVLVSVRALEQVFVEVSAGRSAERELAMLNALGGSRT